MPDQVFPTGATRSTDANHLDFTSIPLIGLLAVARTSGEGADKYGRYNYMRGMPVHDLLNHVMRHIVMFLLGDRSEPHLEHAGWGILAAIQSNTLDPILSHPHLLGEGATIHPIMKDLMNQEDPLFTKKRRENATKTPVPWSTDMIPEIMRILSQRDHVPVLVNGPEIDAPEIKDAIESYYKDKPGLHPEDLGIRKADVDVDSFMKP